MGFGGLGMWEILLILLVLLLVFGARRLPELGGALGKGIREFKSSIRDIEGEFTRPVTDEPKELRSAPRDGTASVPPASGEQKEPQSTEGSTGA